MKAIQTFEEGCASRDVDPTKLPGVEELPERFRQSVIDHYKLMVLTEAVNEGEKPDWNDSYQRKHFPWMDVDADESKPSGFGLSLCGVGYDCASTTVGSRLSSVSDDAARHLATQFANLYEGAFLEPKA